MQIIHWQWFGPQSVPLALSIVALVLLAVGAVRLWNRLRLWVWLLAVLLASGLIVLAQDPMRVVGQAVAIPLRGIIVVDTSASVHQNLSPEDRAAGVAEALADIELVQDTAIDWDVVSTSDATDTVRTLAQARANPAALVPQSSQALLHRTDIELLQQRTGNYDLALVLTDGHWWHYNAAALAATTTTMLGVLPPAWTVPAADIGFRRVRSEVIGLLRHKVRVEFELDVHALPAPTDIELQLEGMGTQMVTTVTLTPGAPVTTVSLDLLITKLGSSELRATLAHVPAWDGYSLNNEVVFRVMGYREKIRTLLISGGPGMDTRNIRAFLKSDPAVELMHFSILRTIEDDPRARNEELSLIPFPYDDLFTQMLPQFDVVILQNFNFKPYFRQDYPKYFGNLAQSVFQSGTGLIMTGGPRSFGDGEYEQTQLPAVLGLGLRRTDGYDSETPMTAQLGRVAPDIPLPTLVPQVHYVNQVEVLPGTVVGLRVTPTSAPATGLPLAPPALLTYHRHGRGHAVGILSPDLFVARSPAQFAALSSWFSQTLRWAAGDLDQFPLDVVISDAADDRQVDFQLEARQMDAAAPLTAAIVLRVAGGPAQILPVELVVGAPVTVTTTLPLAIVQAQILACLPHNDCQVREMYLDPLRRERLGMWESPTLPMQAWNQIRDLSRTELQLQSGRAVAIESESREHLAQNPWVVSGLLGLAALLWIAQRRLYRAVV